MAKNIKNILKAQNVEFEILPQKEMWALQQKWREIYAKPLHEKTGKWTKGQFDWHTFSFEFTPSYNGDKAWNRYRELFNGECYILPNLNDGDGFKCKSQKPINLTHKMFDVYLVPFDFSWTFVNTHEDGYYGPYFCEPSMLQI